MSTGPSTSMGHLEGPLGPPRRHNPGSRFSLRRLFGSSSAFLNRRAFGRGSAKGLPASTLDAEQALRMPSGAVASDGARAASQRLTAPPKDSEGVKGAESAGRRGSAPRQVSSDTESLWSCEGGAVGRLECPLCLLELPGDCFPQLSSCPHRACCDCLRQYLRIEISESRVNISCPECTEPIHPNDIRSLLDDEVMVAKYERFMLRRILVTEPDARWCPAPDCGYVVIASGCASCPKLHCERPGCSTSFCYHCKQEWHPNQTCDAARAQRAARPISSSAASLGFPHDGTLQRDDIKHCPCCKVFIIKMDDGSCNHMTCRLCGTEFCWLCMKEISDLHYLSPSGCTFWGKKPWSRKKKILWQLGMLVGAPVGIALIAGIAVPAIVIGIPVWVGRKLHSKYDLRTTSRLKRNFIVSGGVVASFLVSPIIAGIAVGIGVPILLAYVYGVVPVSLCRSGGCGVTTSASGVRIEFDEDADLGMSSGTAADGASVDTTGGVGILGAGGATASIGEAASLGMSGSPSLGSHLDTATASNTAIAGHSLTGSITSASASHRLEVQAEVSSNKRFSLSSHSETASATVSLSERSANMSGMADDAASTRALAGSIVGYREGTLAAPVEVHVDPLEEPDYCRHCRITHRPCCPNALPSSQPHHCECLDGVSVTKVQIE
ncbi:hypothetical protein HPB47_026975 [Ixodes persulcatus]|uniref:Uncharacterized protein n=1 Tax=Ixodes persulcatus TaxID=34615 RepID=A0AC60PYQ0_IXOPE|nr:hypothetical protein HPB47_026975 [Ixodes persulcatus]